MQTFTGGGETKWWRTSRKWDSSNTTLYLPTQEKSTAKLFKLRFNWY